MIEWEDTLFNVSAYDDGFFTDKAVMLEGGEGKLIGLEDICLMYNLTSNDDIDKDGPTEPVELKERVSVN